jgi:hypothetical protein
MLFWLPLILLVAADVLLYAGHGLLNKQAPHTHGHYDVLFQSAGYACFVLCLVLGTYGIFRSLKRRS